VTTTPDHLIDDPVSASRDFPDTYRLLDDVELLELPDPEFDIEGFLPSRGVGVFYAPPGRRENDIGGRRRCRAGSEGRRLRASGAEARFLHLRCDRRPFRLQGATPRGEARCAPPARFTDRRLHVP